MLTRCENIGEGACLQSLACCRGFSSQILCGILTFSPRRRLLSRSRVRYAFAEGRACDPPSNARATGVRMSIILRSGHQ